MKALYLLLFIFICFDSNAQTFSVGLNVGTQADLSWKDEAKFHTITYYNSGYNDYHRSNSTHNTSNGHPSISLNAQFEKRAFFTRISVGYSQEKITITTHDRNSISGNHWPPYWYTNKWDYRLNLAEEISLFTSSFDLGAYVINREKTRFGFYGGASLRTPFQRTFLNGHIERTYSASGYSTNGHYTTGPEVTVHDQNSELWNERVRQDNNSILSTRLGVLLKHQLSKKFAIEAMIDLNIYSRKVGNVNRSSYRGDLNFFFTAMNFGVGISRQLN